MSRSKTRDERRAKETEEDKPAPKLPLEESEESEKPPKPPRPPTKELPDRSIKLTAKRCLLARSRDPVVSAFLHVENLKGETRKLTREEWDSELEAFKSAPR
jgi:hypothetical protein